MTFADLPTGAVVFLDANCLIYHFTNDPKYGPPCTQLLKRVEQRDLEGFTLSHVLADVAHRLMTLEAINLLGWRAAGVAARLRKPHGEIPKLTVYRQALSHVSSLRIQVIPTTQALVETATQLSQRHELLIGDALVVAAMQANGMTHIASNDADFDRVPGLARYTPV